MVVAAPTYEGKRNQQVGDPKGKRKKLEPLVDWGEGEEYDIWEDWLVRKEEMSKKSDWINSKEEPLPNLRLNQMELNFRKVLDSKSMTEVVVEVVVAVPEVEQEPNIDPEPAGQD